MRITATSVSRSWPMRSAWHSRPSGSVDIDTGCVLDDVAVGEHETVGREDESRAGARLSRGSPGCAGLANVDADNGRRDAFDGMDDGS